MSDTQMTDEGVNVDTLPLPEREITQLVSRKQLYHANQVNTFTFTEDGEEKLGYFQFKRARLISVTGRVQPTQRSRALVVTQGIIIDQPEIGVFDGDTRVPHPLHTDPRYQAWQASQRPKRINAQQWVQKENKDLVQEYVNYLHREHGFSVIQRPQKREGSQRKTQDLFVARPSNGRDLENENDRSNYGVPLNSFEISVNPDYEQGFNSFAEGLEEQRMRWEAAFEIEDDDLRNSHLEQIAQNIHFLGGVYRDEDARTWWARPVDVGMVSITDPQSNEDRDWPLYQQRGTELTEDLFSALDEPEQSSGGSAPTGGLDASTLALPDSDDEEKF